ANAKQWVAAGYRIKDGGEAIHFTDEHGNRNDLFDFSQVEGNLAPRLWTIKHLPEIPQSELENGLLMSRMIIKNGQRVWEIQVEGRETTTIYPEYKQKDVSGTMIWYKFNPLQELS
ncbi:MAG: hypothetical protein LBD23_10360, partial [Oscillospiraceae bacterium]|nr:hypothetical protein [Oscillospiraceae bacterium]